jgi:tetratricopeptide (TPR) repeat protein
LVVSYLHDTRQTPKEWLAEWQRTPAATLDYHDPDAISYPVSLSRVWDKSVARLSPLARDFLFIFASLAPRPAALPIGPIQEPENWPTVRAAFAELAKASLISWPAGRDELSIHRVLQACLRHEMSAQEREGSLEWALKVLDTSLPSPEYEEAGWRLWERLEPHIQVLLPNLRALHFKGKQAQHLIFQYANWLYYRARHRDAEPLYRRALELAEERLGFEDPELAAELSGLSQVLHALNRMEEAEIVCRRALALLEKTSGDHPTLPYCLNTLANIFLSTVRVAEAEPLFRRALSLFEKSLGTDDPTTLTCMHNLATVLAATERRPEASLLLHRALAIFEKGLGPKHPQVAASLNELGELARAADCFAEAEPLYRRAINILEESYGREHPHVASCLNNLALTLAELNQPVEARELLERALTIDFKIHGAEHPKVSNRLKNLAWLLLRRMGETEETVQRELVQIIEKVIRETQGSS